VSQPSTPHFDLPFRVQGGSAVCVEQDTLRDIQNCVEAILRTHVGERESQPTFGIEDPTFQTIPLDPNSIINQVVESEPRAVILAEESPDRIMELIDRIKFSVSERTNS
jgi:phage baseplate assembly protein W